MQGDADWESDFNALRQLLRCAGAGGGCWDRSQRRAYAALREWACHQRGLAAGGDLPPARGMRLEAAGLMAEGAGDVLLPPLLEGTTATAWTAEEERQLAELAQGAERVAGAHGRRRVILPWEDLRAKATAAGWLPGWSAQHMRTKWAKRAGWLERVVGKRLAKGRGAGGGAGDGGAEESRK